MLHATLPPMPLLITRLRYYAYFEIAELRRHLRRYERHYAELDAATDGIATLR